ncbi:MAG: hypothetical protein O7D32_08375 [bacterium]|nr:hypothetical protein [bacterium]
MHNVIVVGSGAAGVAAALELSQCRIRPLVLDVGEPAHPPGDVHDNFYDYKRGHDTYEMTIGRDLQGLSNLLTDREVPVKLTAPYIDYVTRNAHTLSPIDEVDFCAIQSFASGGLANAWGAGLYRYTDHDLEGFPIQPGDLDPYFEKLTEEIGICGEADDLEGDFSSTLGLLPPLELSRNITRFYDAYRRRKHREIRIGRARVGALSGARNARPAYAYRSLDFFQESTAVYSPRYTLDRLSFENRIEHRTSLLVKRWREHDGAVTVEARDTVTGEQCTFEAKKLLIAAGAINTSKIVLQSHDDYETVLPLLENPALQFPIVLPKLIGSALDVTAFGLVQLNLVWDSQTYGMRLQGSIMDITAPNRAEFFASLPYSARANLALIRTLLPSMLVMQLFFPASSQPVTHISLQANGHLRIVGHPNTLDLRKLGPLLRYLRRLGAWTFGRLLVRVPAGHSVHYAGTLPMHESGGRYRCTPDGRLGGTENVFIADSASFSRLTAKNMSFAMMANAMRIAHGVAKEVKNR